MKNFLKRTISFGIASIKQAFDDLQASPGASGSEKFIVTNADRSTQSEWIEDRDTHFVLGYN